MTEAQTLVRRLKPSGYKAGQVQASAFVDDKNPGLSFHEAVPAITEDRAELYCSPAHCKYAEPMGACLVPIVGIQHSFSGTEDDKDERFGRWHHDFVPAPRDTEDANAVELATRATEKAEMDGELLREAVRKGKLKPFRS